MRTRRAIAAVALWTALPAAAGFVEESGSEAGDATFRKRLAHELAQLERSRNPVLRKLYAAVMAAPAPIRVRPVTDDKRTWNSDGTRRAHTEPDDAKQKRLGRSEPAAATAYVEPDTLEPNSRRWKAGVLAHELTHAVDLAYGRYNTVASIRERRATFIQNAWRENIGEKFRTSYHGRFATLDYQEAKRTGAVDRYATHIFTRADFPDPPKATGPVERDDEKD